MDFTKNDFDYYQRTAKMMYDRYYLKRIAFVSVALVIILLYAAVIRETMALNIILALALTGILVYLFHEKQRFEEIYQLFLADNQPVAHIIQVEEDEYSYNVYDGSEKITRVNKKGVRNLPSQNKQFTLMVGFEKNFFSRDPLKIYYYDMLELRYEEKYRLTRNGYSTLPRFLRRFTWTNLKASAGNAASFIVGNIFLLFILYRLIRYLISFIRMMF